MVSIAKSGEVDNVNNARSCVVLQKDGTEISFGSILDQQHDNIQRTLVVFIRHFFCGNCQEYVRRLASDLAPSLLPEDVSVIIVGCGAPSLIQSYIEVTACPFPIYADPSIQLYKLLGMRRSLSLGSKGPAYIQHSIASGVVKSIVQGLRRIPSGDFMQAGDLDVNGGEFLLARTSRSSSTSHDQSSWHLSWSHYMMNSRDHAEIHDVRDALQMTTRQSSIPQLSTKADRSRLTKQDSTGSIRRSLSLRRSWMVKPGGAIRSNSLRRTVVQITI